MNQSYEKMSLTELKAIAREKGIKGISSLKKDELISFLAKYDSDNTANRQSGNEMTVLLQEESVSEESKKKGSADGQSSDLKKKGSADVQQVSLERKRKEPSAEINPPLQDKRKTAAAADNTVKHTDTPLVRLPNGEIIYTTADGKAAPAELDSGQEINGIIEVLPDGYGFIRTNRYLPGDHDVYVSPGQIRRFNLRTGDIIVGNTKIKSQTEKFAALLYISSINSQSPQGYIRRVAFEKMTPVFPDERLKLERGSDSVSMRIMDLLSPVGKGQRGMIVSPPKAGKTTLLKGVANSITANYPDMHLLILLIDERPEEVTDIRESVVGSKVEVIASTFDEQPERHKRVAEMVIERAKRIVEMGKDVTILLDSITRLARAYNLTVAPSGRTLSGGLDPASLYMPKRFFGAARNTRESGSLTILATALVDTGSKMDDVVYEEFKGTGNMELILDRKLQEKRVFPAIDIAKSGTRRDDLLLNPSEQEAMAIIRKALNSSNSDDAVERLIQLFVGTRNNDELVEKIRKNRYI